MNTVPESVFQRTASATWTIGFPRVQALVPAFFIFVVSFGVIDAVQHVYDRSHVFAQSNTLFDADPNKVIVNFGPSWGNDTHFRHPLIDVMFSVPVRASTKALCTVVHCDGNRLRRDLALLVTPLSEAIKTAVLYLIFIALGLSPVRSAILCAANLLALSTLTVGSVPESFPVSSMALVLFIGLMVASFRHERPSQLRYWLVVGTFATGITITNIVPLMINFFLTRRYGRDHSLRAALRDTAVLVVATLVTTFSLAAAGCLLQGRSMTDLLPSSERGDLGVTSDGVPAAEQLAVAISSTFAGVIQPEVIRNDFAENLLDRKARTVLDFRMTYANRRLDNLRSVTWMLVSLALLGIGAYRAYEGTGVWHSLMWACAATLGFNLALHSFFYLHDMFLYALHWQVALLFMLAGWMRRRDSRHDYGPFVLATLVLISAVTGYRILWWFASMTGTYS